MMTESRVLTQNVGTALIFEDAEVRVWMLHLEPGEATEWHLHDCDYTFVVTRPGTVRCEYDDGGYELQEGDRLGHTEYRKRDQPHRLVNVGDSTYQNVVVELKKAIS
jgi:quercetin dioxygenase-like cupin family protein